MKKIDVLQTTLFHPISIKCGHRFRCGRYICIYRLDVLDSQTMYLLSDIYRYIFSNICVGDVGYLYKFYILK